MIHTDLLLAWGASYKKLKPGELLFREGSTCYYYYQVVTGLMRWYNIDDDGNEYLQQVIEEGGCIGELPLFDDEPYAASATAIKESLVLRLPKESFHLLLKEHPDIYAAFAKLLAKRIRFKFHLLKSLSLQEPEKILISLFIYLQQTGNHVSGEHSQLHLTRQQLADMTSLRVETVIRALRRMHQKNVVHIEKGKVYLDPFLKKTDDSII